MRFEDQDGDMESFVRRDRRMDTVAAASVDEQRLRSTAAGLWRQLQNDYERFTEGLEIDANAFSLNAIALGRTVNLAQELRRDAVAPVAARAA